ncbi:helix-turn-helix transcriptional regulator [Accumulibacter sp.]|uniref:helix-turn-helix domain-containing protein n=1 Tax=Accumulibacter sp. TaxID=2053492 RepID=UPI001AD4D52D|nr:helix-turn-helix transcriptional regulator [Accumulibacter sp.]MBN8515758.1 helix-turn-helix transcriptional regulator [Accumulibacter sp.]MBO3701998.1 helix-turn-helix transcriptional regulator [Accumulibacter sp.]
MALPTAKSIEMGLRLRARRKALGFTLDQVAGCVGVTKGAVSQWETGQAPNISAENLLKASLVLGCNPYELLGIDSSAVAVSSVNVARLSQAIEFIDTMVSRHKIKLSPMSKAKFLLYLSDVDRGFPSDMEALRLIELIK